MPSDSAAAFATASETPRMALAPRRFLFGVPSSAIIVLSICTCCSASMPPMASKISPLTAATAFSSPLPPKRPLSPSRSSTAAWAPVEAPDGTPARPNAPSPSTTSTSTVGLPRLSRISRAVMSPLSVMGSSALGEIARGFSAGGVEPPPPCVSDPQSRASGLLLRLRSGRASGSAALHDDPLGVCSAAALDDDPITPSGLAALDDDAFLVAGAAALVDDLAGAAASAVALGPGLIHGRTGAGRQDVWVGDRCARGLRRARHGRRRGKHGYEQSTRQGLGVRHWRLLCPPTPQYEHGARHQTIQPERKTAREAIASRAVAICVFRRASPAKGNQSSFGVRTWRPLYMPVFRSTWCGRFSSPVSLSST